MALDRQGAHASIAVVRYGGHVLPIVDDEAAELTTATVREAAWRT
jgi:hypothetical protein